MSYFAELKDKRVVVVGAGDLGLACAQAFVDHGSDVGLIDLDPDRLQTARRSLGGDVPVEVCDVSVRDQATRTVTEVAGALGGLDVLIHAVGRNARKALEDISPEIWHAEIDANLTSALWCGQAAVPHMTAAGGGQMVFFSSVSAYLAHPHHAAYAASKGGLNQLIKVMAIELAAANIRVNGVAPGYTETQLTRHYLERDGMRSNLEAKVPFGRLGTCEDVVGPVLFLSTRQSSFVTGQVLLVDGGRTLD